MNPMKKYSLKTVVVISILLLVALVYSVVVTIAISHQKEKFREKVNECRQVAETQQCETSSIMKAQTEVIKKIKREREALNERLSACQTNLENN